MTRLLTSRVSTAGRSWISQARGVGCRICCLYRYPDGYRLVEVKMGPAALTAAQARFRERYNVPVLYVRSTDEAAAVFKGH